MPTFREPPEHICRAADMYRRGMFCPAELWHQVVEKLTSDNAAAILAALPSEECRGSCDKRISSGLIP
jgi:hypothetical protein